MKIQALVALVLALRVVGGGRGFSAEADALPPGMINFRGASAPQVLEVYKALANVELITDSRVQRTGTTITTKNEHPISKEQAASLIEKALLEQAGIVITRFDGNRASATYNDALPTLSPAGGESTSTQSAPPTERSAWVMQHYRVDTNSFFSGLESRVKSDAEQLDVKLLSDYLKEQGIDVSPPFLTMLKPETGDIIIRMRQEDQEKINRLMKELQAAK